MRPDFSRVFTLEVGGRSTLAFEARSFREAHQLCKETWLRTDLGSLKSTGIPIWDGNAALSIRLANAEEAIAFAQAAAEPGIAGDMVLAYLIELDGPVAG